jgi:8-oxo-dGTP pyrophosphatase MutT (NUDIX family)
MDFSRWIVKPRLAMKEPNYGAILCTKLDGVAHFALVRRRSSYGLMNILRGDWKRQYFGELSTYEKLELLRVCELQDGWESVFRELCILIAEPVNTPKFYNYRENFIEHRQQVKELLLSSPTLYPYGVWDFPKGKREKRETCIQCAVRELHEETNISKNDIKLCDISLPTENYHGWLYHYFVYTTTEDVANNKVIDKGEISDVVWCTFEDASRLIPSVMKERLSILNTVRNYVDVMFSK